MFGSYKSLLILAGAIHMIQASQVHYTPLLIDNATACIAENLIATDRYTCDKKGNVICINGWENPHHLCSDPTCDIGGKTCVNGKCIHPNLCACDVGWTGPLCDQCVKLGGCKHGTCEKPSECHCLPGWVGAKCNKPACDDCVNGCCHEPNKCICDAGWKGPNCSECVTLPNCKYGKCVKQPFECICDEGYTGLGCTKPVCREGCHPKNGHCELPGECLCKEGWAGRNCDECVPYPNCKGTCINNIPWTCTHMGDDNVALADQWSKWGAWSSCSKSCGEGFQTRTRVCADHHGVTGTCVGKSSETKKCTERYCKIDGLWAPWSRWSSCSASCGSGLKKRSRSCTRPAPKYGGAKCVGLDTESLRCFTRNCPVPGEWSSWQAWSSCSVSCGEGRQSRRRKCDAPAPAHGGRSCFGTPFEAHSCNLGSCPTDPEWLEWESWSTCSKTCGEGIRNRSRRCSIGKNGGKTTCPGGLTEDNEVSVCVEKRSCSIDGSWSFWSAWSVCSATCGKGLRFRERTCSNPHPQFGGKSCPGFGFDRTLCFERTCPVDGKWGSWHAWGKCSASCGGHGSRSRTRKCIEPQHGGRPCTGVSIETHSCGSSPCPVPGKFSNWGVWTHCSATCGNGNKSRKRTCIPPKFGGHPCNGPTTESSSCFVKFCPLDGKWSQWNQWSTCSLTCNGGTHTRHRSCTHGKHGGNPCSGLAVETASCNVGVDCHSVHPGHSGHSNGHHGGNGQWGYWSQWSTCTKTCGNGVRNRHRSCLFGNCQGSGSEQASCNSQACPGKPQWSQWDQWSTCSKTCGGGIRNRNRNCNDFGSGERCPGSGWEQGSCNTHACISDPTWGQWSSWTTCTQTCGGGVHTRERTCNNLSAGGRPCPGNGWEQASCNQQTCGIPGNWGQWGQWASCSVTCGHGSRMRQRECNNPRPQFGGKHCEGSVWDKESCFKASCSTPGNWGEWGPWSSCSVTCGNGTHTRDRRCDNPAPKNGGSFCSGESHQQGTCSNNGRYCPIDGGLTLWSEWSPCTVECEGDRGDQVRRRFCWNPRPQYGGRPCHGETKQIRDCSGTIPKQETNPSGICFHVGS